MNAQEILEQLLQSGQEMVSQGQTMAEEKLNIPKEGEARDATLAGMGKGALAAGGLAVLLGTGAGRRLTGGALKLGGLAALGGLAYQTYAKWQQDNADGDTRLQDAAIKSAADQLTGEKAEQRSLTLIKAMVAAANADGHIDDAERSKINQQISKMQLDEGAAALITGEIENPLDPESLAAQVDTPEAAAEIYLLSRAVIDIDNEMERTYLQNLAQALKLPEELVSELDNQLVS